MLRSAYLVMLNATPTGVPGAIPFIVFEHADIWMMADNGTDHHSKLAGHAVGIGTPESTIFLRVAAHRITSFPSTAWQVYILRLGIQTDHCKVRTLAIVEVFQ